MKGTTNVLKLFYHRQWFQVLLSVLFLSIALPSSVNAHRGAYNQVDTCRIPVGDEIIHFTAYTPETGGTGLCRIIPNVSLTDLVFDYEGQKLRKTTVEFEVTKEPEGTQVFYQAPEKISKGSVNAKVDFRKYGPGNYLAHITIDYNGEKLDSHLPFSVGLESQDSGPPGIVTILISILVLVLIGMVIMSRSKKNQANSESE